MTSSNAENLHLPETPFLGLAPFLRHSIAGSDLMPTAQAMLAQAEARPDDANLWMNLSIAMLCLGHRDLGVSIQAQALEIRRIYELPALQQPTRSRLLMLMAAGDLAENTPLDCLLENSDVDLIYYYVTPEDPLALPIPEHDAVLVALGDADINRQLLANLTAALADWPKPVINAPQFIPNTDRSAASRLLQDIPGLLMPQTWRLSRAQLAAIATGKLPTPLEFPIIVRPVGSQAGRDLERIANPGDLVAYLENQGAPEFFIARFIDYSSDDDLFRKFRIAMIGGHPYICHMAVSSHWMIHYVNAGMYEDAGKREQEARFMADFETFAGRHGPVLAAVHQRLQLDYFCIDCAETRDGQLLIFEADHVMVVHDMDLPELFPYKHPHMMKVARAFRALLPNKDAQ